MAVELMLLGGFALSRGDGATVDLPGQKDRALLAILALAPAAGHSREGLAGLLWSDRADPQARDSLKHSLTRLRHALQGASPPPIVADRQAVRLDASALSIDAVRFDRLASEDTPASLEQAIALYRGDLLDGIAIRDPAFEEWLGLERRRYRQRAEDALARLMDQAMAEGQTARGAAFARRLLALDPFREAAVRALMRFHGEQSEAPQALLLYDTMRKRLMSELGVAPEAPTTELYESIRAHRGPPPPSPAAAPAAHPPLPDKPSIAVLPFQNLSGDAEQEYFADGMVEEIITALSRLRWLFVIARASSFIYRGRAVDVKQIGRELGVRYVLEGSVRKSASRVRITGQLIDAATGATLWADRFEGGLEDVFDLQDQVTSSVVGAIGPKLEEAEIDRAKRKPTGSLDAYDYYLRGMAAVHRWSREANNEALELFTRAIALDPGFASAYGMAARCYSQRKASAWMVDRAREAAEAERLARRAAALGKDDAVALCTAGIALSFVVGELDDGVRLIDRALALNPNWAWAWLFSGWAKVWQGDLEMAVEHVANAMRLSPNDPQIVNAHAAMASAHFFAGRYAEASSWAERAVREEPNHFIAACIVAASGALGGRMAEAKAAMARVRQFDPGLSMANLKELFPIRRPQDFARWADGMRQAGLPE